MRFLLDDNIPLSVKELLQRKGVHAVKAFEIGLKGLKIELLVKRTLRKL